MECEVLLFFGLIYDPKNIQTANMASRFTPIVLLLVGGLILPLIEEVAFRLALVFKPLYLSLSITALTYYLLSKLIYKTKISALDDSFTTRIFLAIVFGMIGYLIINIPAVHLRLKGVWCAHFRFILYSSCLLFAWIHIAKYEIILLNILLLPILTLPQLMSAIIYSYTRIKFGFQYPLILHCSTNILAISLSTLLSAT